jgi:hypothetical protein
MLLICHLNPSYDCAHRSVNLRSGLVRNTIETWIFIYYRIHSHFSSNQSFYLLSMVIKTHSFWLIARLLNCLLTKLYIFFIFLAFSFKLWLLLFKSFWLSYMQTRIRTIKTVYHYWIARIFLYILLKNFWRNIIFRNQKTVLTIANLLFLGYSVNGTSLALSVLVFW